MTKSAKYKKYDPKVKAAISMIGIPDLFPNLKIPRMTAEYWIEQRFTLVDPIIESLANEVTKMHERCAAVLLELAEKDALVKLLQDISHILEFRLEWKHIESPRKRSRILDAIARAMKNASRDKCLAAIGLSLSRYKRWKRERRGCGITGTKSCPKVNINQLTFQEVQTMKNLVTGKGFAHYPIRSLHYYAKRENILYCSYSTWRKYIDQFKWKRPRKMYRERKYLEGIRAKYPNEIWHLDLSYFILPNKTKCYIQAVVDNYSRYVVAWQVLESFDGSKTGALLKTAIEKVYPEKRLQLIVDGGSENKGQTVNSLETAGHFRKQVARFEIIFSNSIVEAVFRSLKHNYLFHKEITTLSSLEHHTEFWFREHNEKIPHSSFNGETPLERFKSSWSKENEIRIIVCQESAKKMRILENQKIFCTKCDAA